MLPNRSIDTSFFHTKPRKRFLPQVRKRRTRSPHFSKSRLVLKDACMILFACKYIRPQIVCKKSSVLITVLLNLTALAEGVFALL